ncbi:PaaI family thioesterase [Nocardia arizonensis]|uniref:PaaI family thioesterase n=1 Tax=Nocardia arizonensis TaxID=1141647 RepID=UPI0006CF21CE|nr:PaaI family thioesterase [Nocardia arizonensis]
MSNSPASAPTAPNPLSALHPYAGDTPDYDGLRAVLGSSVPYNSFVGLDITEVGDTEGVVTVAYRPELTNAFGTLHAGVLFLACDMAGSAAFIGAAARQLRALTMFVLKDCRIAFLKPGTGDVRIVATVDRRLLDSALAEPRPGRFTCDAKAYVYDGTGALIGKAQLDFVFGLAADHGDA